MHTTEVSNTDIQEIKTFFGTSLEMKRDKPEPNATYYWDRYKDDINYCWTPGNPSASEKYASRVHGSCGGRLPDCFEDRRLSVGSVRCYHPQDAPALVLILFDTTTQTPTMTTNEKSPNIHTKR